ncbi:XF1762 family protein [Streptomyces canus]|uniref:XF1762 family protein n=1 Tax=Streptomyces canus TaxID=58343 RepID=UPI0037221897
MSAVRLHLVPVRSREAKDFVRAWHRHHPTPAGQIFAVGAADETGTLRAVASVGRPVARHLDDGTTVEVTRTASDGARNANSLLYGASWRAAKALGYQRLITFTQAGESGASLRGAGWHLIASRPAQGRMAHPLPAPGRPRQRPHRPLPVASALNQVLGDALHTYEPTDLDEMSPRQAVNAVTADIRDHHITVDGTGLFNATRHIDLLCHLAARMAADVEYQLAPNIADLPPAETLGASASHVGRAIAHYTQALAPLITLTTTAQDTLQQKLDSLDHHSRLRIHLDDARRALAAACTALEVPRTPAAASAPTPARLPAPAIRRRA